jgi:predicted acylesterase/phospholipase RssA
VLLNEFIKRPWDVLTSALEAMNQDVPLGIKIDAMVSRAMHGMSRPSPASISPPESTASPAPLRSAVQEQTAQPAQALILSGGGAFAAYEVGLMKALFAGKSSATGYAVWEPDIVTGTSAGSLNAGLLLSAPEEGLAAVEYLEEVWMHQVADGPGKCGSGVFRFRDNPLTFLTPGCYLDPFSSLAKFLNDGAFLTREFVERGAHLLDGSIDIEQRALETIDIGALISVEPLQQLLRGTLRLDKIRASRKKLRIASTNWRTGDIRIFSNEDMSDEVGYDVVQASSSLPGIFPRVEIENEPYVDGGLVMNTPLKPAIDAGAEALQVVYMDANVAHIPLPRLPNTLSAMYRSLVIGFSTTLKQDLELAAKANRMLAAAASASDSAAADSSLVRGSDGKVHRPLTIHLHHPMTALGGSWLSFGRDTLMQSMERGYEDGIHHDCGTNQCLLADR